MPTVTLTVEVPEMTAEELEDAVIQAVVHQVLGTRQRDEDGNPILFDDTSWIRSLREAAQIQINAQVAQMVGAVMPEILADTLRTSFQPTSAYGEAKGTPRTLREHIVQQAREWLVETVNQSGQAQPLSYGGRPRISYLVSQEVERVFRADLKTEADRAATEIKQGLKARISDTVTETVAKLLQLK